MTAKRIVAVAAGWLVLMPAVGSVVFQAEPQAAAQAVTPQRALLDQYCVGCHNERTTSGELRLDNVDVSAVGAHGELWERVVRKLRAGMMPPPGMPRPERATYDGFVMWVEDELDSAAAVQPNPGRTEALHRLNRAEYRNAVRDLLALDMDFSDLLPVDSAGGGDAAFDNIASSLRLSESLMDRYLSTALRVSRLAVGGAVPVTELHFPMHADVRQDVHLDGMAFGTRGGILINHIFPLDGEYEFTVSVAGSGAGEEFEISVDGERVHLEEPAPPPSDGASGFLYDGPAIPDSVVTRPITAGPHDVAVAFVQKSAGVLAEDDRTPFFGGRGALPGISNVMIRGPFNTTGVSDTPSRSRILTCRPASVAEEASCAASILSTLGRRAYRRPLADRDVELLMNLYEEGRATGDFEAGIQRGIRGMLVNPNFLFRVAVVPSSAQSGQPYQVSDLELASRLSFFLWSSIPDDELLDLAVERRLREPGMLEAQVRRMLADDRSRALTDGFAAQWLWVRNLDAAVPFDQLFPNFDQTLREAFKTETELFFDSIVREDRSVLDLLDADYTFVNERLARHYDIPNVIGTDFRRVQLSADSPRRGLLGKGHLLLVTSRSTRTSPVVRGVWILTNLLGTPPPAPPANVPALEMAEQGDGRVLTMRELMAQHRSNPVCASCHATIDPTGFALEQFDAVGKWREVDPGFNPIDASGTMPDGTEFSGFNEFRSALVENPELFLRTMAEKLLIYALGRPTESYDGPAIRQVVRDTAGEDYKFSSMVMGIVTSVPFQMRMSAEPAQSASAGR